jgi:hypothetical protein
MSHISPPSWKADYVFCDSCGEKTSENLECPCRAHKPRSPAKIPSICSGRPVKEKHSKKQTKNRWPEIQTHNDSLWRREVVLILLPILKDPSLISYFIDILKSLKRGYEGKEAMVFHTSLRISKEERWSRTAELRKQRKFHNMNASVPVTCTLPFDGGMWRRSKQLVKNIRYFKPKFIIWGPWLQRGVDGPTPGFDHGPYTDARLKDKIRTVNLIQGERDGFKIGTVDQWWKSPLQTFLDGMYVSDIEYALDDYEIMNHQIEEHLRTPVHLLLTGVGEDLRAVDTIYE